MIGFCKQINSIMLCVLLHVD
uniref:Uncharacterized protein n=1 Tax=Anguilla anguilla TaxID=7936 RepID=A0A0E9UCJ9_ANGAN